MHAFSTATLQTSDTTNRCTQEGTTAVVIHMDTEDEEKPVAYASKNITPAETMYANTEEEMLAVGFGCMKFHHCLYVWEFTCQGDHEVLRVFT